MSTKSPAEVRHASCYSPAHHLHPLHCPHRVGSSARGVGAIQVACECTRGDFAVTLSIVIPAYNEEVLLGRCLDAVIAEVARSGRDVEIVVVNNASTDATGNIAARYPVRVVDEPNRGIVQARNRGLTETTGELVANLDAAGSPWRRNVGFSPAPRLRPSSPAHLGQSECRS